MSSFNEEYLKLRKKRLEEQASRGATGSNTQSNGSRPVMLNTLTPQASSDIAPVRQTEQEKQMASNDERKWFQKGAFEDGYQFGDLTKTIFSSSKDLETNVLGGILGIGEKVVDAGAYLVGGVGGLFSKDFKDDVGDFIAKDLYDEEAVARKIVGARTPMSWFDKDIMDEGNSVLGEKTDALAQSGGQLLGTIGLQAVGVPWFLTSGVTSFGSEAENALNQGATYGQAGLSAAINAGVEIATEKLFGGSGLGEKGLINLDGLTKGISNKVGKALLDFGLDMTAEGAEEVVAQIGSNFASALYSEKNLQELLFSEEAFDQYLESFIGCMALGGFANVGKVGNSIKTGRDYRTGLTESEQKVFDNVYNKRVAEAQEGGKELSKKEKDAIYDAVMRDLEKGGIDIDTIEEVLGEDVYKSYKDTIDYEDDILKQFEELGNKTNPTLAEQSLYAELKSQADGIKQNSQREAIKSRLSEEVFGKVKDTKLAESYNERARRGQVFEADLSQYDEKQQDHVKRAVESGVLNDTNRTREIVGLTAKIEADKGVRINYVNNKMIKDMGIEFDGVDANGFVKDGEIYINVESPKYLQFIVGHEITHTMEQHKELYAEMQKALFDVAKSKGEYDSRLKSVTKTYEENDPTADPTKELTADLVGDYLFTDEDFVRRLSTEHRNVFQKVWDEIKHLWKMATAGSKEARELEKAMHLFEKVYKESGKASEGTKYSISDSDGKQLTKEQSEYFKDSKMRDENGNLKVMYHGSQDAGFHVFDPAHSDDETSLFFVDRNDVAASYSGTYETYEAQTIRTAEDMNKFIESIGVEGYEVVEKDGKFTLLYEGDRVADSNTAQGIYDEFCWYEGVGEGDANYKVYLNLTNPLVVDAEGRNWNNITREYSQEVADRYNSLTAEEKAALSNLAEWGEYGIFKDEMLASAKGGSVLASADEDISVLARAYQKLGGANANLYDAFSIASDNFSAESIQEFAVKQMNTRDYAQKAKAEGYDGVIFNNLVDVGGYGNGSEGASTVAIAFSSNQIKSVANEQPGKNADIRYSLSSDSEGRKLSDEQKKYFNGSKVVDANGNLKVMHHGSPETFTVFDRKKAKSSGTYGNGFYFTDSTSHAATYGDAYDVYLNITNPLRNGTNDITKDQIRRFVEAIAEDEDYGIDNYGYDATIDSVTDSVYGKSDFAMILDLNISCVGNMVEAIELFNKVNGTDYDGIIAPTETVAFYPNQIKSVDNLKPTKDPDIRFSLSKADDDYISAVESGDMETAQRLVEDAANKAGYTIRAYHGTPNAEFTVFDKDRVGKGNDQYGAGFYFTTSKTGASHYGNRVIDAALNIKNPIRFRATAESGRNLIDADITLTSKQAYEVVKRLPGIYDAEESPLGDYYDAYWEVGAKDWMVRDLAEQYKDVGYLDSDLFRNYPNELHEALRDVVGFDGVEVTFESTGEKFYVAWFNNQIKSIDTVTHDDNGNVIPLSERFNLEKDDIRNSLSPEGEPQKRYGNYNIYGKDVRFEAPMQEQVAPMQETVSKTETVEARADLPINNTDYSPVVDERAGLEERIKVLDEEIDALDQETAKISEQVSQGVMSFDEAKAMVDKTTPRYNQLAQERVSLIDKVMELERAERERFGSIDDTDAPPEVDVPIAESERQALTLDNRTAKRITQEVSKHLGLNATDTAKMEKTIRKYAQNPDMTESELFEEIRQEYQYTVEMEVDDDLTTQAKQYMRRMHLYVPADLKGDFDGKRKDGFNQFRKEHFGHFYLTTAEGTNAIGIDQAYQELREMFPGVFPEDVWNAADQLQIMGEVADYKAESIADTVDYDNETIQEVCDIIRNGVDRYSQESTLKLAEEARTSMFVSDDFAPIAEEYKTYDTAQKGQVDGQQTMFEELPRDNDSEDRLEQYRQKADRKLEAEKRILFEDFEQRKATLQNEIADKDAYISQKAAELYKEISNLKKGVRASKELGYILDHGFDWKSIKAALINAKNSPGKMVNSNPQNANYQVESVIREMLNEDYESKVYDLDDIDTEYAEEVAKLEAEYQKQFETFKKSIQIPTRSVLHAQKVDAIKAKFSERGFDLDKVLENAKNLSTLATVDNTPQRVMEKALGYKEGQILADETVNKVAQNETEGTKWLNSITSRKDGLLKRLSEQYHIKPGSKESAAAQMYAEGFYVNDNGDLITYGDTELAKDFPDAQTQKNIKGLVADTRIRRFYDDTLAQINESRTRNAYPEIQPLDNYYLHFHAMDDTFSKLGIPFNPNDIKAKDLPTDLNGVTADLKPGQPYFASSMHRRGNKTTYDLLGGIERYATAAKNQIYHIDDIQTLRALRNYIADTYGQANGLEGLDALSEEEAQDRIKQVYGAHLSTFAKFLNEEANVIAGKTALIDRGIEGIIGRRGITFIDTINKQVGSNMVGFNVSSSLTNFLAGVQAIAKTSKVACLKSLAQTASSRLGKISGKTDSFVENNPTMIRREGADRFYRTPFQKVGDAGYVLMQAVDSVTTEFIVRAKYNEYIQKGMSEQDAITEADKWTSRLMGDRSLGQMPQLYNSKMLGIITKFQLEVRNQLDSQFYDTIQEAKVSNEDIKNAGERNAKTAAKVTATLVELAVLQHLFGKGFEAVAGYNPAFDIISVLATLFGFDDDEESEDTALDNIEQGFLELLEDLPYTSVLTGGRIPISSALPITELIKGEDEYGNEKSRLETLGEVAPYYILPTGYGQVKKTAQGLSMFSDEHPVSGSYTDSGNLRFPVEETFGNVAQAAIFGQWANKNAREYFDNDIAPLNPKQTQEYIDVDMPIQDYWDYRKGLKGLSTLEEKAEYINGLDLTDEQKNILINNIANRKDDLDMSDYEDYENFDEFDYASKYPEKYAFLKDNGISYSTYNASKESREAYNWAYNNPEKYTLSKAVSSDVVTYRRYTADLYEIKADKDASGKSIVGSRKDKVADYINGLDISYEEKIILFKSEYNADDTYNYEIIEYLNNREDISYEEMVTILQELGFTVKGDTITWD